VSYRIQNYFIPLLERTKNLTDMTVSD